MKLVPERDPGGAIRLVAYLTTEEASALAQTLRELTGDARPPAKPPTWVPLRDRADTPKNPSPKPPAPLSTRPGKSHSAVTQSQKPRTP